MRLNVMDAHYRSFEQIVLPIASQKQMAIIGMKPMGDPSGIDSMDILQQALDVAERFTPLTPQERGALLARTANAAKNGEWERYKVGQHFDSTSLHPEWLG